jgi:hypothetical protein
MAAIVPLAQDDVVQTIISGIHPLYQESFKKQFVTHISERYAKIITASNPSLAPNVVTQQARKFASEDYDGLSKQLNDEMFHKYTLPIVTIVSALPKDELALMAETLVNITSYMRRVSADLETVGGATDVAVISKKDGFIWIKRKHYFDAEHNYQFFTDKRIGSQSISLLKELAQIMAEIKPNLQARE